MSDPRTSRSRDASVVSAAMDRYAVGDDAAFAVLYDGLAPRLFGFLLKQTRSPALAEDLLQQTFLHIHRARGSFIAGADVLPWAFSIARRLIIDNARKAKREVLAATDDDVDRMRDLGFAQPEGFDLASARELAARLRDTLDALPETQRTAFALLKEEGLSLVDAAEVLGTTVTAVKLRAHRAYEAIRAALRAHNSEEGGPTP